MAWAATEPPVLFAPPKVRASFGEYRRPLGPAELEEECLEMSPFLAILV